MARANVPNFRAPRCRLAFSDSLFEAKAFEGGKPKFGATFIFETKDVSILVQKLEEVGKKEWGDKYEAMRGPFKPRSPLLVATNRIKWPILDGDGPQARAKETGDLHAGFGPGLVFIRASTSDDSMPVEMRARDPHIPATRTEMYSGCYVMPVLNAYAWTHPMSGNGLSFGLSFIQKVADGEPLGGRAPVKVEQWFVPDAYEDEADAATAGASIYD